MARAAGMSVTGIGLADVVRLWAQALRRQPDSADLPANWIRVLRNQEEALAQTITVRLQAQQQASPKTSSLPSQLRQPQRDALSPPLLAAPVQVTTNGPTQPDRLQAPVLAVLATDFQPESSLPDAQSSTSSRTLIASDYGPLQPEMLAPWLALAPRSRWWTALHQFTPSIFAGADLPRMVNRFARGRPPRRLLRLQRRGQFRRLLLLYDARKCMRPHMRDFDVVLSQLRAYPLAADLRVEAFHGLPPFVPVDVDAVLLLGDLGLGGTFESGGIAGSWIAWARAMARRGVATQAWMPVSAQAIPAVLARELVCVPWHERSRFRRCRGAIGQKAMEARALWSPADMSNLWSRLAIAQRIEPTLLRRARLLVGGAGRPEWETMFWQETSEHVAGEQVLQWRPDRVVRWRRSFADLSVPEQLRVWRMFTAQHAHLPRSTLIVERLVWRAYARDEAVTEVADAVEEAEDWLERLAAQEAGQLASNRHAVLAGKDCARHSAFLHGLVLRNRLDAAFTGRNAGQYAPLAMAVGRMGQGAGLTATDWAGCLPGIEQAEPQAWSVLLRQAPEGPILEKWIAPGTSPIPYPPNLRRTLLPAMPRQAAVWQPEGCSPRWLDCACPAEPGELGFRDSFGVHRLKIGELKRAAWQGALGQDRYGVFCEVQVEKMRLRFRHIPPGTFLQGSSTSPCPDFEDEHPQHLVTLSREMWLAEMPCTQVLWWIVMGSNPSFFSHGGEGPMRPVERVEWDDVKTFLDRFQRLLPSGCEVVLPTESQWEYACRAGTQTEYWWGDEPDDDYANWLGQKKTTSPVGSYPPNPWGLYDMHGNVWEWCADGPRKYVPGPQLDPWGPDSSHSRAVRGGSWTRPAADARAPARHRWLRWDQNHSLGFRFALVSSDGTLERGAAPSIPKREMSAHVAG